MEGKTIAYSPPFAPPESVCETFTCIQNSYVEAAVRGPFNLTAMVLKEFGVDASVRLNMAFSKVRLNERPVVENAIVTTHETGFKVSGDLQSYADRHDAHYEGIYVAEHAGFVSMHTGITFGHQRTIEEEEAKKDNTDFFQHIGEPTKQTKEINITDPDFDGLRIIIPAEETRRLQAAPITSKAVAGAITWLGGALGKGAAGLPVKATMGATAAGALAGTSVGAIAGGVAVMTFARALVAIFGWKSVPKLGFLNDEGGVGLIMTVRAQLSPSVYESVSPLIQRLPENPFKMSGVLEDFVLTSSKVMLIGTFSLDRECQHDKMCQLLQQVVPEGTRLQFIYDAGLSYINFFNFFTRKRISAGIGNIRFHEKFVIHDAAFVLDLGLKGFYSGITGTLLLQPPNDDRELRFLFELALGLPFFDYQAHFGMEGVYERAFGIPFLHFGNMHGEVTLVLGAFPTQFRVGGEFWLGKVPKDISQHDTRIRGSAFIGFDMLNPMNTYFYGFLSTLTLQSVLDMIYDLNDAATPNLPPFLGETGLHALPGNDGVLFSFTPFIDYTLEFVSPPRTIKAGFTMAGKASLFGLNLIVDVNFDILQVGCEIFLGFEPIVIGNGLLTLAKSINNTQEGPTGYFKVVVTQNPMPYLAVDGYAAFLGMGMGFNGHLSQHGFRLSGDLRLFNVVDTHAEILWNKTDGLTQVRGNITQREGFLDMLEDSAKKWWTRMVHRRLLLSQNHTQPVVLAHNTTHLSNMLQDLSGNIYAINALEADEQQDIAAVQFADGRMLSHEGFFDFVPFRIRIEEMSFLLNIQKEEEKQVFVKMRIRKTLFGKTTYFRKSGQMDIDHPAQLIQDMIT